jgi:hypothetical protein
MRLSVATLRRLVKGDLRIEFVRQELTRTAGSNCSGGICGRSTCQRACGGRARARLATTAGPGPACSCSPCSTPGRAAWNSCALASDPLVARFCGLARIPTGRTVANWLRQFTQATLAPLVQLNHELVTDIIARLALPSLTIDVDSTVVRAEATVAWAFRGFNPHHRRDLSYYPLLAHLSLTGHIRRPAGPLRRPTPPWSSAWTRPFP